MADFYDTLGVSRSASADELKRAYRKKVRELHPDRNRDDPDASDKFDRVQKAYDTLSDPEKRKLYDQFGEAGVGGGNPFAGAAGGDPFGGAGFGNGQRVRVNMGGGGGGPGFASVVEEFMRGFAQGGGFQQAADVDQRVAQEPPATVELPITFYEAVRGSQRTVTIRSDGESRKLEVRIPPNVPDGGKLRVRGQGHRTAYGERSDLIVTVRVAEDFRFTRDGKTLYTTAKVPVSTAALGGTVDVPTLDGRVTLKVPAGTSGGSKLRIRGQGGGGRDESPDKRGDLVVTVQIELPKPMSDEQKGLFERLRDVGA